MQQAPTEVLLSCESHKELANSIISQPDASFITMGNIKWGKFEDGFPNLMINNIESIRSRNCVVLLDFFAPREDIRTIGSDLCVAAVFC